MDPTDDELNNIDSLVKAFDWAGVPEDVRTTLGRALGSPTMIRDVVFVARAAWDEVVAALKGLGPEDDDGNRPERELSHIDKARLEIFRRVCFKRVGAPVDSPGVAPPVGAAPTASPPAGIATSPSSRKLKLSAVLDQTLDAEVIPLGPEEIAKMFESYRVRFGDDPNPDSEPTGDQISGLRQVLSSGSVPYIDFAIFGPHGLRLLRRLTFSSYSLNSSGEWARKEMPGPPDWESWSEIFRCMRTAFLLLESVSAERLDAYHDHLRQLAHRFGPTCWDLVYVADVHMRSEQFERIRRRFLQEPQFGFTRASPWNAVFAQAIREDAFWSREVITPATLRLARGGGPPASITASPNTNEAKTALADSDEGPRKKKKQKVKAADDASKHNGSIYTHNKRGAQICEKWNNGKCGNSRPQSKCDAGRSHQCNRCLGPHQGKECKTPK